jgi:hypothetical protein
MSVEKKVNFDCSSLTDGPSDKKKFNSKFFRKSEPQKLFEFPIGSFLTNEKVVCLI